MKRSTKQTTSFFSRYSLQRALCTFQKVSQIATPLYFRYRRQITSNHNFHGAQLRNSIRRLQLGLW